MAITVSIVEDNDQLRGTLARVLSRAEGFRCLGHHATAEAALLAGGERITTRTLVSTVPSGPNPLVAALRCPMELCAGLRMRPSGSSQGCKTPGSLSAASERMADACAHRIYGGIDEGDWVRPDRGHRQGAVIG